MVASDRAPLTAISSRRAEGDDSPAGTVPSRHLEDATGVVRPRSSDTGRTLGVRIFVGLMALMAALVLLGGPAFGFAVLVSGGDLHIRGGALRLVFDLAVGSLLMRAAMRRLTAQPAMTAA